VLKVGYNKSTSAETSRETGGRRFPHGTSRYCQVAIRSERAIGKRSVEGAGPLSHRKPRWVDLEARPLVAALGPDYIRPTQGPGASTCFHFTSRKPHIHDHFPVTIYVLVIEVQASVTIYIIWSQIRCYAARPLRNNGHRIIILLVTVQLFCL
jgi:hypothetical protein